MLLLSTHGLAQSAPQIAEARAKAKEGFAALTAGNAGAALASCTAARSIEDTPPVQLCVGKAQSALGRHEDARATLLALSRRPIPMDAPTNWVQAQREAAGLLPAATRAMAAMNARAAEEALERREFSTALKLAESGLVLDDLPRLRFVRGQALIGLSRFDEARGIYQDLLARLDKAARGDADVSAETVRAALGELDERARAVGARQESDRRRRAVADAEASISKGAFNEALDVCEAVYKAEPLPEARLCIARGYQGLNQRAEALRAYESLLGGNAKVPPEVRRAAERSAEELRAKLSPGKLELRATPLAGLRYAIDAEAEREWSGTATVELKAGPHLVRAAAPGHRALAETVTVVGAKTTPFALDLAPLPRTRMAAWVTLGLGSAALATSAVLSGISVSKYNALVGACTVDRRCGDSQTAAIGSLNGMRVGTFVAGGVGVASLLASSTLFLASPSDEMPDAIQVSLGLDGLTLHGAF